MRSPLLALGLLTAVIVPCSASAATFQATLTGLVNSTDPTNPFTGEPTPTFTLTFDYTIDPSKVTSTATQTTFNDNLGSETASISIDGVNGGAPVKYTTSGYFEVQTTLYSPGASQFSAEIQLPNNGDISVVFTRSDGAIPNSVTTPIPTLLADGGIAGNISNYIGGYNLLDPSNPDNDIIDELYPSSLTVTQTDIAVMPLPSAAPMFGAALLGLAGFGFAANRKKATATA